MRRKEYVEQAKNLILNRVRFHAPIVFDDEVDGRVLWGNGIDENLPVFKFEKTLTKSLVKAFSLAQQEEKFNLVICGENAYHHNIWCSRQLSKMRNTTILGEYCSKRLLEMVNKLNINYASSTNFNLKFRDKFFCVNGTRFNPAFDDFCLCQQAVFDEVYVDYAEFVLNGQNIFAKVVNKSDKEKKLSIELNIPLEKGYYYFKKLDKAFLIENLLSKQKMFFNFLCGGAKFSFSNVDGLENSVFCCVNVKLLMTLRPKQRKILFFNLGQSKMAIRSCAEVEKLKQVAAVEAKKVFDVQVKTKNPQFDYFFNKTLPQRIWVNWLNGRVDESLEQKYVGYRRLFVKGKEKISFVNFAEIGLKELGIFNGEYYKKILFVGGHERFLKVGGTFFYQIGQISTQTLQSREPVCLCFGD